MKSADLEHLSTLCRVRAGLRVDASQAYPVLTALGPLARREGFATTEDLLKAVRLHHDERLVWAVVETLANTETSFFHQPAAFDLFEGELLPAMVQRRGGEPIRVWSAACATGQEAYGLAMLADEARVILGRTVVELLGSDLSERCLEKAQSGLYTHFEVQRGLPVRRLLQHFDRQGEMWAVDARLRQAISWRRVNLLSDVTQLGRFDVIFLRNVLSGLDPQAAGRVLDNIAAVLAPDGFLVLGEREGVGQSQALRPLAGHAGVFTPNSGRRAVA